jgi:hypothetical protein
LAFFRITEEDTDPFASGSSNQLDQESGFGFIETAPAKKKKNVIPPWMKHAAYLSRKKNNLEKMMSFLYLENLWRIKFEI